MKTLLLALSLAFASPLHAETFQGGKIVYSFASTVTAAGTTTLTSSSASQQDFTGTSTQTVILPDATTLKPGMNYWISNDSTGTLTIQYSGGGAATTLLQNEFANFFLQANGTAAGTWDMQKVGSPTVTGTANRAAIFNGSGILAASSVTDTTLAFMDATSSVQTQINSKITSGAAAIVNADVSATAAIARSKLASGSANHVLINDGSGVSSSEANLAVSRGGTGLGTLTANNVILGNGTSTPTFVAPSTSGNVLTSNGTTWQSTAPAASSGAGGIYAGGQNLISNNSFETNTTGWTSTATGTGCAGSTGFARTTTAGQYIPPGSAGACFDSAATGETLIPTSVTITTGDGLSGRNGVASCALRANSGTSTITLTADDGTNDLVTAQALASSTTSFQRTSVNFVFPASGTVRLKLKSVASNEPVVFLDDCYLGLAEGFNVQQLSQGIAILDATRITSSQSITATTPVTVIYNSASYDPYSVLNTSTGVATMKKAGTATVSAQVGMTALDTQGFYLQVYKNGSAISGCTGYFVSGSLASGKNVVTPCSFTVAVNDTIDVRTSSDTDSAYSIINGLGSFNIRLDPLVAETGYRPDQSASYWSGYHDNTCSFARTATTLGDPATDASCALVEQSNVNFGTVTGSNSLPSITFTPSRTRDIKVKVRANLECATAAATITASLTDGTTVFDTDSFKCSQTNGWNAVNLQAKIPVSASTGKTLKIQTSASSGAVTINPETNLTQVVKWDLEALDTLNGAPILIGSVTSNSTGAERIERAYLTSACTVTSQSGSWIQGSSHSATGKCDLTVTGFSALPDCTMVQDNSVAALVHTIDVTSTSTLIKTQHITTGSTFTDSPFHIICMGPR